ncbi:MAG TPA: glycosyltransferase family 4 protein [Chitinophagaceae bacterium]|nr:glycosyltransferase family 4 protein [Chitinophagaceae bacterium]
MITHSGRPRVFTWHIHGSYLFYLSQANLDIYIPVTDDRTEGYVGRGETFPFGDNVIEVSATEVKYLELDCIIFQTNKNYLVDQYDILSHEQRQLPRIYLEHDPPRQHPTDTQHAVNDPDILLVHVTQFNRLMWDCGGTPCCVIEHGVTDSGARYTGTIEKGIVVINNLPQRGRICGFDIFRELRKEVPLDLIGMGTEAYGIGEVLHPDLPQFVSRYRFFFNPIRYTSLGLAVCEAMMMGMPVVGLATTEMTTVIRNGMNGYVHTDPANLVRKMKTLLNNYDLASAMGKAARRTALERFNIKRFTADWERIVQMMIEKTADIKTIV